MLVVLAILCFNARCPSEIHIHCVSSHPTFSLPWMAQWRLVTLAWWQQQKTCQRTVTSHRPAKLQPNTLLRWGLSCTWVQNRYSAHFTTRTHLRDFICWRLTLSTLKGKLNEKPVGLTTGKHFHLQLHLLFYQYLKKEVLFLLWVGAAPVFVHSLTVRSRKRWAHDRFDPNT